MRYSILLNLLLTFFLFVRCCGSIPPREDDLQRSKHVAILLCKVRTRPDRPWGTPSLLHNGCLVFHWSKAAGAWRWPTYSVQVKKRAELYTYSRSGPSWPLLG